MHCPKESDSYTVQWPQQEQTAYLNSPVSSLIEGIRDHSGMYAPFQEIKTFLEQRATNDSH